MCLSAVLTLALMVQELQARRQHEPDSHVCTQNKTERLLPLKNTLDKPEIVFAFLKSQPWGTRFFNILSDVSGRPPEVLIPRGGEVLGWRVDPAIIRVPQAYVQEQLMESLGVSGVSFRQTVTGK